MLLAVRTRVSVYIHSKRHVFKCASVYVFVLGIFGTGVCSYFLFLRWLLYLNMLVCILTVAFLLIPQVLHRHSSKDNRESFSGLELITGEVW